MKNLLRYKGIHPGIVLLRLLEQRGINQRTFALAVNEHPQTINAITKARRNLNTALALKIEKQLGLNEGAMAVLQTYYDIRIEKKKQDANTPNLELLRSSLFWDTDSSNINWDKQYKAVIERVFERGNASEKEEIMRFYGKQKVKEVLHSTTRKPYSISKREVR
jgi:plasmid maintenance system antidote protein VapI